MADNRQVPSVPANTDPILRNFLSAVREALNNATASVTSLATTVSSSSVTQAAIAALSPNLANLLDSSTPPTPTGFTVVGMRVNNFLKWTAPNYSNLNFTEVWRAPALMDAAGMVNGTAYVISILGTINWTAIGATAPAIGSLVNGTQYIITALGTINWNTIGVVGTPAIGTVFTYNGATVTGAGGTVLATAFTKNATAITGTGGTVQFSPALASATLAGTSNGQEFVDSVDPGSVFAYWIRHISNANVQGPWNSNTGTIGATSKGAGGGSNGWTYTAENLYAVNAWIAEADVLDGTITNAKIGSFIQSTNYSTTGHTGWNIDKTGNITAYGSINIYDNTGAAVLVSGSGVNAVALYNLVNAPVISTFNPIQLSNITSYIQGAAIGNAQIGNAAVNTLQIQGNAVTVPLTAYTALISGVGMVTNYTAQTLTISPAISTTDSTTFEVFFGFFAENSQAPIWVTVTSNNLGTLFANSQISGESYTNTGGTTSNPPGIFSGSAKIVLPANSTTIITLTIVQGQMTNIRNVYITAIGMRR